jgi:hypothetical protein
MLPRHPGEQRCRFGGGRGRPLEPDAVLLVERLRQRDLPGLVAPRELLTELAQALVPAVAGQGVQDADASVQVPDDAAAQGGLGGRFGQVDLDEAGRVRGGRQVVEEFGDRAVAFGRHPDAVGVDPGELAGGLAEPARDAEAALVPGQG